MAQKTLWVLRSQSVQWVTHTHTHHKLLLVASHASAPLCVLVSPDQQLHQPGNGALLTQSAVVRRAEGQVADEANGGLEWEEKQSVS